jgi:hypothetical protein
MEALRDAMHRTLRLMPAHLPATERLKQFVQRWMHALHTLHQLTEALATQSVQREHALSMLHTHRACMETLPHIVCAVVHLHIACSSSAPSNTQL